MHLLILLAGYDNSLGMKKMCLSDTLIAGMNSLEKK